MISVQADTNIQPVWIGPTDLTGHSKAELRFCSECTLLVFGKEYLREIVSVAIQQAMADREPDRASGWAEAYRWIEDFEHELTGGVTWH